MNNENKNTFILWTIAISILGHIFIILLAPFIPQIGINGHLRSEKPVKLMELTQITKDALKKYRTVGIKNGDKEFSAPIASRRPIALPGKKNTPQKLSMKSLQMNIGQNELSNLANKIKTKLKIDNSNDNNGIPLSVAQTQKERIQRERSINKMIKREMLNSEISSYDQSLIKNADMNMHFTPPEGVDESELNSVEKKLYGFHRRAYQKYVNSFLNSYHKATRERPYIDDLFRSEDDDLTGRVTFDKEGNLVSIKIIKWANNDEIQKIFEKTLEGIKALKNPPDEFIKNSDEFSIYYTLKIKN